MEILQIQREQTHFNNPFISAFLNGKQLADLSDVKAELAEVPKMVESRLGFEKSKRSTLVKVIKEQYANSKIQLEGKVLENINALENENSYTVTTGQQIHLALGPLYVLYKILNTLALCEEINEKYSTIMTVPIFWMATEDHDFEEIKSIHLFNKKIDWEQTEAGAVGRMSTKGIAKVFEEIKESFNLTPDLEEFINAAKHSYSLDNYADASRHLIHKYFGKSGLVVLDADNEELKQSFIPVIENELAGLNYSSLEEGSNKLEAHGFDRQIHIRDINLFYLKANARLKIEKHDNAYKAEGETLCSLDESSIFIQKNAVNFSPNVALRPLYQEWILPNLIYVGGPSEVKYWLQLTSLFKQYNLKMPALFLRTSWVIAAESKYRELSLSSLGELYDDDEILVERYSKETAKLKSEVLAELTEAQKHIAAFNQKIEEIFKGFSLSGKINKLYPKLLELQNLSENKFTELGFNNPSLKKLQKFRNAYVSKDEPQERVKHILEFSDLISELQKSGHHSNFDNLLKINHLLTKSI